MKVVRFRIKRFRSIVDSGWVPFSPDGVTVLVGQNESGKSSILEALYFGLSGYSPTLDDFRVGVDAPEVSFELEIESADLKATSPGFNALQVEVMKRFSAQLGSKMELVISWRQPLSQKELVIDCFVREEGLRDFLSEEISDQIIENAAAGTVTEDGANDEVPRKTLEKRLEEEYQELVREI